MSKQTVLITGCSSGFGRLTAKLFHAKGWNVIATMRSPEKESELNEMSNTALIPLDVTDPQSVDSAVAAGLDAFGRIDALVNNAGISGEGIFEQFDDQSIKNLFDANVLGLMRVTRAVLPTMRQQGGGAVVNLSSLAGLLGAPNAAVYSATKFAVEGFTEAMAIEYSPFNIKFKVIAPGAYATNLIPSTDRSILENGDEQVRQYSKKITAQFQAMVENMQQQGGAAADPQDVADRIYQCATEDTPIHNIVGVDAEAMVQMKQSLSEAELIATISGMFIPQN